jgi:hypothetical protein
VAVGYLQYLVVDRQHPPCLGNDGEAALRKAHAGCALVEQFVPDQRLQPFDLRADRGLGDTQHLRGLGEAS